MKQFFKMMFASALGVFIAAGLLVSCLIFLLIGVSASMSEPTAEATGAKKTGKCKHGNHARNQRQAKGHSPVTPACSLPAVLAPVFFLVF